MYHETSIKKSNNKTKSTLLFTTTGTPNLFDKLSFTLVPTGNNDKVKQIPWPCLWFDSKEELLNTISVEAPFLLDGCCRREESKEFIGCLELQLTIEEVERKLKSPYPVALLLGPDNPSGPKAKSICPHDDENGGEQQQQRIEFMPNVSKFRVMYSSHPGFDNGLDEAIPIMAARVDEWKKKFMVH